jgi:hypothetical protein
MTDTAELTTADLEQLLEVVLPDDGTDDAPRTAPAPESRAGRAARLRRWVFAATLLGFVAVGTGTVLYGRLAHAAAEPAPPKLVQERAPVNGVMPFVTITAPRDGLALRDHAVVEVAADDGGAPVRVDLFVDADWVGSDEGAPYSPEWEHRSPGVHELKAKVTDADGNVRYSEPVEVTVVR